MCSVGMFKSQKDVFWILTSRETHLVVRIKIDFHNVKWNWLSPTFSPPRVGGGWFLWRGKGLYIIDWISYTCCLSSENFDICAHTHILFPFHISSFELCMCVIWGYETRLCFKKKKHINLKRIIRKKKKREGYVGLGCFNRTRKSFHLFICTIAGWYV